MYKSNKERNISLKKKQGYFLAISIYKLSRTENKKLAHF